MLAPIFTGGRLRALADASGSRRDQALIAYQRVVLNSFAEVETQLYAFDRLHEVHENRPIAKAAAVERSLFLRHPCVVIGVREGPFPAQPRGATVGEVAPQELDPVGDAVLLGQRPRDLKPSGVDGDDSAGTEPGRHDGEHSQ